MGSTKNRSPKAHETRRVHVPARLLELSVEQANDGVVITDARRRDNPIIYVNPAFERMTGYTADEVIGKNCRFLQGSRREQPGLSDLRDSIKRKQGALVSLVNLRKDGSEFWNELSITPLIDRQGQTTHFVGIQKDVTARVKAAEQIARYQRQLEQANRQLRELATHDALTGLLNRRSFAEALERELRRAAREKRPLAVVMFDIDYFKQYNDTYGHLEGDKVLRTVGAAVRESLRRAGDVAARFGGEELVVLAPGLRSKQAMALAENIRSRVRALGIRHTGSRVDDYLSLSAGVTSMVPRTSDTSDLLLTAADQALYRAKRTGRNCARLQTNRPK
jgi:two-component system, cell cycle response regulator